jgi:hypothetical protein
VSGRLEEIRGRAMRDDILGLVHEVGYELLRAIDKFPSINSPHEGKAVIEEELDELWTHVKANTGRSPEARREAIQTAAMALRYALDLCEGAALAGLGGDNPE